ncbi:MAG TPA: hypothetical protein VFA50_22580 [Stellaceae bacterium]|nr:hypothetical protein [Stellaceae bacterium]
MSPTASAIIAAIRARPQQFAELADAHRDVPWPDFLHAWGEVRRANILGRDDNGNYRIEPCEDKA